MRWGTPKCTECGDDIEQNLYALCDHCLEYNFCSVCDNLLDSCICYTEEDD